MKTIILCGGIGYRLKEETEFKPKPMVLIGGKPILWHIMKIYGTYRYNEFIIALGYKGDYIKDYFLNQKYFQHDFTLHTKKGVTKIHRDKTEGKLIDDFKITFVDTGLESLTGERVRRVRDYVDNETFMLTYGDGVGDINVPKLIAFHKKKKAIATITGVHPKSKFGLIRINNKNFATEFRQKMVIREWINGGFTVLEPEFFDYLYENEMVEVAFARLAKKGQLAVYTHDGFWKSMDTYQDMIEFQGLWSSNPLWKLWKD